MVDRLEWAFGVILRGLSVGRPGRGAKTARVDDGSNHLRRRAGVREDDHFGERIATVQYMYEIKAFFCLCLYLFIYFY